MRLKALYSFMCLTMYFKINFNREFNFENQENFNKKFINFSKFDML